VDVDRKAGCRIYAVLKARPGARAQLEAALAASDVAAVLVAGGDGERPARAATADLIAAAQHADIAALILDDAALARELGADGVHLAAHADGIVGYQDARGVLGTGAIVGSDCGASRHVAMTLAEAGADYIAFGAPPGHNGEAEARKRRDALVAWWAEIFEVPCVAFDVETAAEAEALSAAGADFLAVTLPCGQPEATRGLLAEIAAAIQPKSTA
jgi:thiamine-phosphate pyrophosphorylase